MLTSNILINYNIANCHAYIQFYTLAHHVHVFTESNTVLSSLYHSLMKILYIYFIHKYLKE